MFNSFFRNKLTYLLLFLYLGLVVWWIEINARHLTSSNQNLYFGFVYALVAILGGLNGLRVAYNWGGFKSTVGRGISFFSIGLLSLACGQLVFSYYNIIAKVSIPFPSAADFFYLSIVIFYILGSFMLFKAAGSKFTLKSLKGKVAIVAVPAILLAISYFLFLKNLTFDFSTPKNSVETFLSFSTPFGDAIYMSVALLTYQLSRKFLGGVMRGRILFLIFALTAEYAAEYVFLYQAANNTYYNGGIDDLLFATSITIMALGLNALSLNKSQFQSGRSQEDNE